MTQIFLERRMTLKECNMIWSADFIPLREMAFFRGIYVTRFRPDEMVNCDISDLDKGNQLLTAMKVKRRHIHGREGEESRTIRPPPKTRKLDDTTYTQLCKLIGRRKAGPIFVTRTGERCHYSQFKRALHEYADILGIQKIRYITDGGKKYYLVSLTGLREAGERHEVLGGGSELIAAKCSDHTQKVQRESYMGIDTEEIIIQQVKHHPFFQGEKDE